MKPDFFFVIRVCWCTSKNPMELSPVVIGRSNYSKLKIKQLPHTPKGDLTKLQKAILQFVKKDLGL